MVMGPLCTQRGGSSSPDIRIAAISTEQGFRCEADSLDLPCDYSLVNGEAD
jgi:hypothetical protein